MDILLRATLPTEDIRNALFYHHTCCNHNPILFIYQTQGGIPGQQTAPSSIEMNTRILFDGELHRLRYALVVNHG